MTAPHGLTSTPYRPATAADALGDRLRTRLIDGRFVPGETLSIRRIAEAEGVSVIPARDALRGLVAAGALEFRDSRTIRVPALDPATADEIACARVAIEGELAARAYPSLTGRLGELMAIDRKVTNALTAQDVSAYMAANRALHFAIYEAAGAPVLLHLAEALWLRFGPSMRIVCTALDGRLPGIDHHEIALSALAQGRRDDFTRAVRDDIAQGMALIRRHTARQLADTEKDHRI